MRINFLAHKALFWLVGGFALLSLLTVAMLTLRQPVEAATNFSLDPNGTSHIGWVFGGGSSWDNKNATYAGVTKAWKVVTGSALHAGSDYYSDDWVWGDGASSCGKEVYAPFSGNIIYKGQGYNAGGGNSAYGYEVIIQADANNNFAWRAAHLQAGSQTLATRVNAGDYIGKVGNTGTTSCHLHSALYKNIYSNSAQGGTGYFRLSTYGTSIDTTAGGANPTFANPFYNDGSGTSGSSSSASSSSGGSVCASYSATGIVLFNGSQCVGSTKQFNSSGFRNLTDLGFNDTTKSMYIQNGWSVRIYEHTDKGGANVCMYGSKWDLAADQYDGGMAIVSAGTATISSIEVFQNSTCTPPTNTSPCQTFSANGIVLFDNSQCSGSTAQFSSSGFRNLPDVSFNDRTKSMYVQNGWSARIYEHNDKQGATRCVNGTMYDLSLDHYQNGMVIVNTGIATISSIEVFSNATCTPPVIVDCNTFSATGVVLFDGSPCLGNKKAFSTTGFTNLTNVGFNDVTRSMYVQDGWSARIYEHSDKQGASRCVSATMWNLAIDKYENGVDIVSGGQPSISSIEVFNNTSCTPGTSTPACATYNATGITLFGSSLCTGTTKRFTGAAFVNLPGLSFNDKTKSIFVQNGWSVRIYEHTDRGGATRCINGTMWDLSYDKYNNGLNIVSNGIATISSIQVFNNTSCTIPDTTLPTGSMTAPVKNSFTNASTITLAANASDTGTGVARVEFYVKSTASWSNNVWKYVGSDTAAPYQFNWTPGTIPDGLVYASAVVIDNAGNRRGILGDPAWTYFKVDRTAPIGKMTAPLKNSNKTGASVTLTATASDNLSGVSKVEFYVWSPAAWSNHQWIKLATDTTSTYSYIWSIVGKPSGNVYATIVVYDKAGNSSGLIWDPNWTNFNILH